MFQRPDAVHRSIVELNALTDSDGTRTEHDYAPLAGVMPRQKFRRLVFAIVIRVEIRRLRLELRSAGVHHAVPGKEVLRHGFAGEARQHTVGVAELLTFEITAFAQPFPRDEVLKPREIAEFMQKPVVDHRDFVYLVHRNAAFERREHHKEALVVAVA